LQLVDRQVVFMLALRIIYIYWRRNASASRKLCKSQHIVHSNSCFTTHDRRTM